MLTECRPLKATRGTDVSLLLRTLKTNFVLYLIILDITHWVGDVELESVIAVWTFVFAFKITNVVECRLINIF